MNDKLDKQIDKFEKTGFISELAKNGVTELVIREGKARELLPEEEEKMLIISGTIGAPLEFLMRRYAKAKDCTFGNYAGVHPDFHFDSTRVHVVVNRENMTIQLVISNNKQKSGFIVGTIQLHPKFEEFGINNNNISWTPIDLGKFIKMNRAFMDRSQNMNLVSVLKNFDAKISSDVKKSEEQNGSRADSYSQVVDSNLPEAFMLRLPMFKGCAPVDIEVEFDAKVSGREVSLKLISPAACELIEIERDRAIDEQIKLIREIEPDMIIIEQ